MPRHRSLLLSIALIATWAGSRADARELEVTHHRLANGLELLIHEDHDLPLAASALFYRSGSAVEQVGLTGMAHLFEHMMFNGSKKFGPGSFDALIEAAGGSTNGYTTRDFTAYVNDFPPEALELILDLEADRMGHLLVTEENLEQERAIVKEERRLRIDEDVGGTMLEQLYLLGFLASPYRWSVAGFMADLDAIDIEAARDFFRLHYSPKNATLVIAGALDTAAVLASTERAFAGVHGSVAPPGVANVEPEPLGARRVTVHKPAELPAVLIGYQAPSASHALRPALDVLDVLLSDGETSRLHRELVYSSELATATWSDFSWQKGPSLFSVYAQARPEIEVERLEEGVLEVIRAARERPPDEHELRKAKNKLLAGHVRGMTSVAGKANRLGYYHAVLGDYRQLFQVESQWESVTAQDVTAAAKSVFVPRRRTTVVLRPEPIE